jgi:hypothetical protein
VISGGPTSISQHNPQQLEPDGKFGVVGGVAVFVVIGEFEYALVLISPNYSRSPSCPCRKLTGLGWVSVCLSVCMSPGHVESSHLIFLSLILLSCRRGYDAVGSSHYVFLILYFLV